MGAKVCIGVGMVDCDVINHKRGGGGGGGIVGIDSQVAGFYWVDSHANLPWRPAQHRQLLLHATAGSSQ